MRDLLGLDLTDLAEVVFFEVRTLLGRRVVMLSLISTRLAPVFAVVHHLDRNEAKLLALRTDHLREPMGLTGRADIHTLGLARGGLRLFRLTVVKRDLRQACGH